MKKYICSVSFGKDSLAMLLRLLEENRPIDEVVFFDTGMEFEAIYNLMNRVIGLLAHRNIPFVRLTSSTPFWIKMLIHEVNPCSSNCHYGYEWCGGRCRWGTTEKISKCQEHYADAFPDCEIYEYVGIAFDEQERITDNPHKLYPLAEWGMTEADCLQYCYQHGYNWNEDGVELYDILDRVSCWCCGNKNLKELKNIYLHLPKYWSWLKGLQSRIDRPFRRDGKTIFDLEDRFKQEERQYSFTFD